jgi:AcrR family transcriptional regulator
MAVERLGHELPFRTRVAMTRDAARLDQAGLSVGGNVANGSEGAPTLCRYNHVVDVAHNAGPGRRSDARRNRRRLIEAAREVMREQGLDASLGEIARRAGLGNATLYRHFPTREALCEAVFAEYGNDLAHMRERLLQIPDAWDALRAWLEESCALSATDQAFADLVVDGMPQSPALHDVSMQAFELTRILLGRAQRQGVVRSDVQLTDVLFIVCSVQRLIPAIGSVAPGAGRRFLTIALDGLRPHESSTLPSTALTLDQFIEIGERAQAGPRYPVHRGSRTGGNGDHAATDGCLQPGEPGPHKGGPPAGTGAISDELWELIEPELPTNAGRRGRPCRDHRQTLEAILWRYRTGCPWRDLPIEFGPWKTLWKRHHRWTADGSYQRILERVLRS